MAQRIDLLLGECMKCKASTAADANEEIIKDFLAIYDGYALTARERQRAGRDT
jgi:hypothetical protein